MTHHCSLSLCSQYSWPPFKVQPTNAYKILRAFSTKFLECKNFSLLHTKLQREKSRRPKPYCCPASWHKPGVCSLLHVSCIGPIQILAGWEHHIIGQIFLPLHAKLQAIPVDIVHLQAGESQQAVLQAVLQDSEICRGYLMQEDMAGAVKIVF